MKKYLLSIATPLCVSATQAIAQFDYRVFEKYLADSTVIEHPILAKVFPGVEFRVEYSGITRPMTTRLVGCYENHKWVLMESFNYLNDKVANAECASVEDRLEAFSRLLYWTLDPNISILSHEKVSIKKHEYVFSHRLTVGVYRPRTGETKKVQLLFAFDGNQIVRVKTNGKVSPPAVIDLPLVGKVDAREDERQVVVQIIGGNHVYYMHEPWLPPHHHIYLCVGDNGNATDSSLTFAIRGLDAGREYRITVVPRYWDAPDAFLDICLIAESNGTIGYTWTPQNNDSTGSLIGDWNVSGWEEEAPGQPEILLSNRLALSASPNPFNPATTLGFDLPEAGSVEMTVFNAAGQKIAMLVNGYRDAGRHEVTWDASGLPAGVYLVAVKSGTSQKVQKVLLVN